MSKLKTLLPTAVAALAALALTAPVASAGITDSLVNGDPYTGSISGASEHFLLSGFWGSTGANAEITGEITDSGWPAKGTIDLKLDVEGGPPSGLVGAIMTDGPYEFQIDQTGPVTGEFAITEPVTFTVISAMPDCVMTATEFEGTIQEGAPAEIDLNGVEFVNQNPGWCGAPGDPIAWLTAGLTIDQPLWFE